MIFYLLQDGCTRNLSRCLRGLVHVDVLLGPTLRFVSDVKVEDFKRPAHTWRLLCSSFLVMICFLFRDYHILYYPKRKYIGGSR